MRAVLLTVAVVAIPALFVPVGAEADERQPGWQPGFTLAPYGWLAGLGVSFTF
jgi:hypothetical protein